MEMELARNMMRRSYIGIFVVDKACGLMLLSTQYEAYMNSFGDISKVRSAEQADRTIRYCAIYWTSKGMTQKVQSEVVMKMFREMKQRLLLGCWADVDALKAYVYNVYGLPLRFRGNK